MSTPLAIPHNQATWRHERSRIRRTLRRLLGDLPPPEPPDVEITSRTEAEAYTCHKFQFHNGDPLGGAAATVPGYLLIPRELSRPAPLIIYYHWHGGEYGLGKDQIWRPASRGLSPAEEFTTQGYAVCAIDAYGFGERSGKGPGGPAERGRDEETSLAKLNLWYGRTLWGMMLRDEHLALDYALSRPEIDPSRVAAAGISMGSTRVWWSMALDSRIGTGVAVACLTRYQDLIRAAGLREHGIYYFVPGMLRHFDTEAVVACCAPGALLCLNGDSDTGSPPSGIRAIETAVTPIYELLGAGDRFASIIYPGVGHEWTPEMWGAGLSWLHRFLH